MHIVLLVPPWSYNKLRGKKKKGKLERILNIPDLSFQGVLPPIAIVSMGTYLKKFGHEVSLFDGYFHDEEKILEFISKNPVDIIGISVVTPLWDSAKNILKKVKSINNKIFTIIGGPHANTYLRLCLDECPDLDAVGWGDGEAILPVLAEKLKTKDFDNIPGLLMRDNSVSFPGIIDDVNILPFPDIKLLNPDINSYTPNVVFYDKNPFSIVFTTRGCGNLCAFCNEGELFNKVRKRTVDNLLKELDYLVNECKVKTVSFYDDINIFSCDKDRSFDFCNEIINRNYPIRWTLYLTNFNLDKELILMMKNAGCFRVHLAIESGVQKNRDYIRGNHLPLEKINEMIINLKEAGIETFGRFMFGIYGETFEDGLETIKFANSLDLDYASFIKALLSPGTRMFKDLEKEGKINPDKEMWSYYGNFYTPHPLKSYEVDQLIKKGYLSFYFDLKKMKNIFNKINSIKSLQKKVYALYRFFVEKINKLN